MSKANTELQPANWQITATTIHCDMVDDFVTIMINKDWSMKCAWYNRYKQKAIDEKKRFDKEIKAKIEKCQGPECSYLVEYRDKLIQEESDTK